MKTNKKVFLKLPEYPGGKEELNKYLRENLQYPELARINREEGIVYVKAEIDDDGVVSKILIEKGLGFGCNEEAIRLISGIRFGNVKNRGKRVKITRKFRIEFKLPEVFSVKYNFLPGNEEKSSKPVAPSGNYTYTVTINRD